MSARMAVCLLTCDRADLTAITVESFSRCNGDVRSKFELLHCDGGSRARTNGEIARAAGFRTLIEPAARDRIGQMATLRHFLAEVKRIDADYVVWLENDWMSVSPLPSLDFVRAADVDTLRLFGDKKARAGHRSLAGRLRIGTNEPIDWTPASAPGWEAGVAHWGAGGTIVRTDVLERQADQPRLKDVITANPRLRSWRPRINIMWSIGTHTTEGFLG